MNPIKLDLNCKAWNNCKAHFENNFPKLSSKIQSLLQNETGKMHSNGMPVEPTDNYKILSNHLILSSIFEIGKMVFSNRCSSQFGNHHAKNNYNSHFESISIQDPSTSKIHKSVIPWYHKKQLNPDTILEPNWKPNVKLRIEKWVCCNKTVHFNEHL